MGSTPLFELFTGLLSFHLTVHIALQVGLLQQEIQSTVAKEVRSEQYST